MYSMNVVDRTIFLTILMTVLISVLRTFLIEDGFETLRNGHERDKHVHENGHANFQER
jgi:hypothetical protein